MPNHLKELKSIVLFTIFLAIVCSNVNAQNRDYKFEKLSIKDGLSHSNVYTILQDKHGYMWFGTQDGLDKYDGYKFVTYRHSSQNSNSLSSSNFGKIYQDTSGVFWFGTFGGGLDRFDPETNTFTNFSYDPENPTSIGSNQIYFVFRDSQNTLWIGTSNGGLNKFNEKQKNFERYIPIEGNINSFSSTRAKCVCETSDGTVWIGSGDGLNKYNKENNNFTVFKHDPNNANSLSSNSIQHLFADESDIIWIASRETGLSQFNPKTNTFKHYFHDPNNPNSLSDNNTEYILKDSYGNIWIGTYQGGLNKFDPNTEKFTHYIHDLENVESISHNRIEYLFEDASHNLWIATRGGGINKIDLKPQKFYNIVHNPKDNNSLPHPSVMSIDSDKDGNLWIGTDGGGLSKYNPKTGKFIHFQYNSADKNTISSNRIWSVLVDKDGIIWAGTYRYGLNRIEIKNQKLSVTRYSRHNIESRLSDNQINTIVEDHNGDIWLATSKGLNKLIKSEKPENYTFKSYFHSSATSNNYINNLYLDSQKRLWVGSYSGGLFQFFPEKGEFIQYSPTDCKNSDFKNKLRVLIISEDNNGNILLGTESSGIIVFNPAEMNFSEFPSNNNLKSNMIIGMLEDNLSNLWVTTSRGLYKYSPLNNKINKYSFVDGLESSGFNRNAALKCSNGMMYIGSNLALTYFNPLEVSNNPYLPKIIITDLKILNKSVWDNYLIGYSQYSSKEKAINITNNDYVFSVEFTAADYTTPQQNQYKYILEGFDEDWIAAEYNRVATYTNLNPGTYTFKVKGSNNDKTWNETPASVNINVIPPFYKKWWFISLLIILATAFGVSFIKLRLRKLVNEKLILEQKVKERTNEIHLQKEELRAQAENLEKTNQELENQQEKLEILVHKRTNDLEAAKEKAEESDRLKSAFLANMSHEIRTPMNAIVGFSNLLNDDDVDRDNRIELTQLIKKSSNTLLNLVDDIIDIAKIESGQLNIKPKDCSVNKVLNDLLIDFDDFISSNNNVTVKIREDYLYNPLNIVADTFRLYQVLRNLLSNALKFTENGIIEVGYNLTNTNSIKEIEFFVKDTGIGLTTEQQEQIFSRFTKVEDNKKKVYRGAGLGLSITKSLVELMGGKVSIESEMDKGSIFYVTIPLVPVVKNEEVQKPVKKRGSKYDWSNKSILVAEDEESNFKFLEMIIRKSAASILWARTGIQAVEMCQSNEFDLILMDIKMPEMDGLEAIKEIRKHNTKVNIIVQSAYSMPEDRNLSFEAGANDFISKPIGTEKLLGIIDKHFNS